MNYALRLCSLKTFDQEMRFSQVSRIFHYLSMETKTNQIILLKINFLR